MNVVRSYWTFRQPAEDGDVYLELLRISTVVTTSKTLHVQKYCY